jgi:hypothetical protein
MGTRGYFPLVKWWGHEADHSSPSSDLVPRSRMVELYLHSPKHLHGVVLNFMDDFTFNFTLTYIMIQYN